jgi:glycosyltransferase involved in cell wall biosynthesis
MKRFRENVWIVVAAYREQGRLSSTLSKVLAEGYRNVVVVDDGSPDDTAATALVHPIWLLKHPINLGQGAALQTGIDFALERGAEIIVTFDADGQHDATEIASLVEPVIDGTADIALGSRFLNRVGNVPYTRKLILKAGVWFTRVFSNIRVTDTHNGFRAMSRATATKLHITQNRMAHASEILDRIRELRLRYVEVPVTIRYTAETLAKGQSSWNAIKIVVQLFLRRVVR